ncbi:glutamine amidotransferase of anthranilate synthase [Fimicolochytrium jonesii]|uniref:glutamine amidotransferase of anthranilate synthase n=1 Tax=Fimicolochytrium jonesii TaxID=1396493 RepID=UPI0022FE6BBD|nr:glutamine amidotransferase of anthranilate synthase [Fimicolochytrium jonesii]KAI8823200.1 glutamine amidotransferase of anthranilate synthase [Fimicolochytrium jonesii]
MTLPPPHLRTLIVDNYDSYTFNLYQYCCSALGRDELLPVVIRNNQFTWDFGICADLLKHAAVPILGVCLGHQGLAAISGGQVVHAAEPFHGRTSPVTHTSHTHTRPPHQSLRHAQEPVQCSQVSFACCLAGRLDHEAWLFGLPECLKIIATTKGKAGEPDVIMGLEHREKPIWGVQFHPESICTEDGSRIIENFHTLAARYWETHGKRPHDARDMTREFQTLSVLPEPLTTRTNTTDDMNAKKPIIHARRLKTPYVDAERVFTEMFSGEEVAFWLDSAKLFDRILYRQTHRNPHSPHPAHPPHPPNNPPPPPSETFFTYISTLLSTRGLHTATLHPTSTSNSPPFPFTCGLVGLFGEMKEESLGRDVAAKTKARGRKHFGVENGGSVPDAAGRNSSITTPHDSPTFTLAHPHPTYLTNVHTALREITNGETYEVCLTTRISTPLPPSHPDPYTLYTHLRAHNPAPYGAFLRLGANLSIASSSPERFMRVEQDATVSMKPIKGTAKRAERTPGEPEDAWTRRDEAVRRALEGDEKNRAENLMVHSRPDPKRPEHHLPPAHRLRARLMHVESYATVHQLVTTVQGRLRTELNAVDAVMHSFPPGSMTGAPKLRTVDILETLEKAPRGPYSGVLGYFSLTGAAEFSVVIRTAVVTRDEISVGAGGAIIALSDPEEEYREMLLKANSVLPR